ncbi:hypothetical protein OAB07_00925 [Candidatus Pelagibacter sp.]|nr:hypothetical protein [Candidatus Pelagibacter sp.]
MNNIYYNRYFILINKKKILFQALDTMNNEILSKEIFIDDYSVNNIYSSIGTFLEKNIIDMERNLKDFIKEIYIVFESDFFFVVGSSIKHSLQKKDFDFNNLNDTLLEMKNQFKKYSPKDEIIHMVINKYTLGKHDYEVLPKNINNKNLIIHVNFICLKDQIIDDFKKIFFKYQISVNKILSCDYLKGLNDYDGQNIFKLADQSINGLHKNEVLIANKTPEKSRFF